MQHRLALALVAAALLLSPTFAQSGTSATAPTPYPRPDRTHQPLSPAGSVETMTPFPHPPLNRERLSAMKPAPVPMPRLDRTAT